MPIACMKLAQERGVAQERCKIMLMLLDFLKLTLDERTNKFFLNPVQICHEAIVSSSAF